MRLINRGDLSHEERDPEFKNILEKLTDFRQIIDIIQNSPYPMIETLNTIIALKGSNNLEIRESGQVFDKGFVEQPQESSGLIEKLLSVEEVSQFRKSLNASEIGSGKLLILGGKTCGKTDFIRQFNQGSISGVKSDQELDFTTIELAKNFNLQVFGIALEEKLSKIVETLSEGLVGYIFLIDSKQANELEYTNYVINNLTSKHEVPCAIAVTNLGKQANKIPQKIKSAIHLSNRTTLMACDVTNKDDVRKVLMSFAPLK
jgi:signal recognition particle receptor subunit beta